LTSKEFLILNKFLSEKSRNKKYCPKANNSLFIKRNHQYRGKYSRFSENMGLKIEK